MAEQEQNGGRHSELTEEHLTKAKEYLQECRDSYRRYEEVLENEKQEELCETEDCDMECGKEHDVDSPTKPKRRKLFYAHTHSRLKVELPSVAGLAVYLGVARSTIYYWRDQETDIGNRFSDIIELILAEQEKRLINNGVSGTYSGLITKLILGKHGYSDKIDHTTGDKPIQASPEAQALAANAIDTYLNGTRNETTTDTTGATGE